MDLAGMWFFLSLLILVEQAYKDVKSMTVDDRYNYMLFGYAVFFALATGITILDILKFTLAAIIIGIAFRNSKIFAKGDQHAIMALLFGNYAAGVSAVFMFILAVATLALFFFGRNRAERIPGFPVLFVVQLATALSTLF